MRFSQLSLRHALCLLALGAGLAAVDGCGASIIVIDCDDGRELCDQKCVDTDSNEDHCGSCNNPCDDGTTCVDGECRHGTQPCQGADCGPACEPGLTDCGGTCVDQKSDVSHCGACFKDCADGQACVDGDCGTLCACDRCDIIELPEGQSDVTHTGTTAGGVDRWAPGCSSSGAPDVAFRFVAPVFDEYVFDTQGSSFDTVISLLSVCSEVACVDDTEFGGTAVTSILLDAGQEVIAIVDGYGGSSGNYSLHVYPRQAECPGTLSLCDGFCVDTTSDINNCGGCFIGCGLDSICVDSSCVCDGDCGCDFPMCGGCNFVADLLDAPGSFFGSTEGLGDFYQPTCVGSGGPEALHTFFASEDGTYVFDTNGSSFDTVLAVLDGSSCGELACNDDFKDLDSRVEVELFAGQEVVVVVDTLGNGGEYELNVSRIDGE